MRTTLAYPGTMPEVEHVARALAEAGALDAFVTTFAYREAGMLAALVRRLPGPARRSVERELRRRSVITIDDTLVRTRPAWEIARTAATRLMHNPVLADLLWDRSSHDFDRYVARRFVPHTQAIAGYEYTVLAAFERARELGVARILHLPSLDSRATAILLDREMMQWPELARPHDAYFAGKLEARYARRRREIALADVIVTNSALTARSHVAAGADPAKVVAVTLAAPTPIGSVRENAALRTRPLNILWAGTFAILKGAHVLLDAWRRLAAGGRARLDVYGRVDLPARALAAAGEGVTFHGSVPKSVLFPAMENADVLVFPTLCDGFGMVVTEAFAHGLPVITTEQAGAADLVTTDNGMIVPAGDPAALADALQWCLDNRPRLGEMRHHALATARRRQWSDFRRELIGALDGGLTRAGYKTDYRYSAEAAGA